MKRAKKKNKPGETDRDTFAAMDNIDDQLAHLQAILDLISHADCHAPPLLEGTLSTISESALNHLHSLEGSIKKVMPGRYGEGK
jgi:hypothetical protein